MKQRLKTIDLVLCALFTALVAVGAFLRIPVPYVPFTLQLLFTTLAGLLLGAKLGALSVLLYILLGLAGLPVFTQGGGIGYVLQPTFGYIIGFLIAAFVTGKIANTTSTPSYKRLLVAGFIGMGIVYLCGMAYFYMISHLYLNTDIPISKLLVSCFLLFVPGDSLTCLLAVCIGKRLIPILHRNRISGMI